MTSEKSNPSPYLHASRWSRLSHSWITRLFDQSHKQKTIELTDLYDLLPEYESVKRTEQLEDAWFDDLQRHPTEPSLLRATMRLLGWKPLLSGFLFIFAKMTTITEPLLIIFLMDFFQPCSTMSSLFASFLAILTVLIALLGSFAYHRYYHLMLTCGMRMRVAYHGLIYRKVLRLSSHSLHTFSSGQITNLFSNDAGQIEIVLKTLHNLWSAPFDIIVMIIFFWYFVKYIAFLAIGYTVVLALLISLLGRSLVYFRGKILKVTDQRVKMMAEIVQSMRIVKMYCWETAFDRRIRQIRKKEITRYAFRLIPESIHFLFTHTYISITCLIMYGTMWSLNMRFDTRFFAISSCMLIYLELSLLHLGTGIRDLANYLTAAKRIQAFLLLEESERDLRLLSHTNELKSNGHSSTPNKNFEEHASKIQCHLQRAYWQKNESFSLNNIQFNAHPGDLICIIGSVGCGKSSLLQTLTGEIAFFYGTVRLQGSFCYVPQESWIFSSTVKKNILFGKDFDAQLFRRVIRATALDADFAQLSDGMNTMVGDQGVMLSGGQKARVNMARALYRDADIYLLDDPLSAVDVKVSKHLFERSIKSYLRDKICLLVTHQIQFLQDATQIIVLENGAMVSKGTYEELFASSSSFRRLLENIHQQEEEEERVQNEHQTDNRPRRMTSCVTVSENDPEEGLLVDSQNFEAKQKGVVKWHVYIAYFRAGAGLFFGVFLLLFIFGFREVTVVLSGWWLAKWSEDESHRHQPWNNCSRLTDETINIIRSMNETEWNRHRNHRFYFYCKIVLVLSILSLIRIITMKAICLNSVRILHNKMFRRLIRAPIVFFDSNPIGRIMNRFTKDLAMMDEQLPTTVFDFSECIFQVLGAVGLVIWLNPWSLIPAILGVIAMLFLRHRFARCLRDLKRLESTTRSPLYSYLTSTIHGLKVIRSYRAEKTCLSEFSAHLDSNTRASYLFLVTNRWAAIRFDWITVLFIAMVTAMALIVRIAGQQFSAADIALTLSYSLNLTGLLQWTVRQSVEIETQMTSVERVLEYCELDQEPPAQLPPKYRPSSNWPSHGHITFHDVCMSHSNDPHAPLALDHITLTIQPREKIGIVGRTGAGKSSFIQTLFRMGTLVHGQIIIDNIDIATVGLDDVRRRISIIPQDPVLFTGTMRSNLDQFGDYSDTEIWYALEQVQLKKLVSNVMSDGLQSLVSESGSNLSVGQKQLVCLARAILKKSKILVIDEATANVDNATDELIQRSIRDQFEECTVLTVAHRLRTVIDSDRILVFGNGSVLEFGSPQALLSDGNSQFSSLVDQAGAAEAEHLRILVSDAELNARENEEIVINNEKSLENISEIDPLI